MIFAFLLICIVVGLVGGLIYLLYLPIKSRLIKSGKLSLTRNKQINRYYVIAVLLFSATQTYLAYYPTDSFYFDEFESVTFRKLPSSAKIVKKAASYPDFHGDYCSSSLIKLSKEDYLKLYNELLNDNRLSKKAEVINAAEFNEVLDIKTRDALIKYSFQRIIPNKAGRYNYIGFLSDGETVVINKCKT